MSTNIHLSYRRNSIDLKDKASRIKYNFVVTSITWGGAPELGKKGKSTLFLRLDQQEGSTLSHHQATHQVIQL